MHLCAKKIQEGADAFLFKEYVYLGYFIIVFFILIVLIDDFKFYTAIAFFFGAVTSLVCGYIGMKVATQTNYRVCYKAATERTEEQALAQAFIVAFRGGIVMGFCLVSIALFVLLCLLLVFKAMINPGVDKATYIEFFEYIAGYGLGGSSVALFCRVGGGIFTKAADVGADLVGKTQLGLEEDDPNNPATIADNVGDNVGDIAGMGADLFGSLAESTCAALVVSGTSTELTQDASFYYPLMITGLSILVCIITAVFATNVFSVQKKSEIESTLKWQLNISTILLVPTIIIISWTCLPAEFTFNNGVSIVKANHWGAMGCVLAGLLSGLAIGYITDYYTSNAHSPVQELSESCKTGAAINIINGLALGYLSCLVPIVMISLTIYFSFILCGMYGMALAALGMLSNLSIGLAIDGYGPISDNAGGIAEMSGFDSSIREKTDALDAAGNTTAAIGKGFAIGSACLVSLALFGAFVTRTQTKVVDILQPIQLASLLFGAMIPYLFSALTMKSVGTAAAKMCEEVQNQVKNGENNPQKCIEISTEASLKEMILPGVIVLFTPLVLGGLFGPNAVAGYLAGVIVSGIQLAISASNTGGAWDNAKKFIEAKQLRITDQDRKILRDDPTINNDEFYFTKKSKPHEAAVIGDTVGDPLKDTSGPSINILVKLSAIVSLVFGSFISKHSLLKL